VEQQLSTPAKGVSLEETGMLELVSALVGGVLASTAGALAAIALLAGLRRFRHLPVPVRRRAGRRAMVGGGESKRPS